MNISSLVAVVIKELTIWGSKCHQNNSPVAVVIKELTIWGSKCHQNNSPVVCDGYVEHEEAQVNSLVAILKTNNCGGGPCGIQ